MLVKVKVKQNGNGSDQDVAINTDHVVSIVSGVPTCRVQLLGPLQWDVVGTLDEVVKQLTP
jgi:hypothetical protein